MICFYLFVRHIFQKEAGTGNYFLKYCYLRAHCNKRRKSFRSNYFSNQRIFPHKHAHFIHGIILYTHIIIYRHIKRYRYCIRDTPVEDH